jgi:hypothetical protein
MLTLTLYFEKDGRRNKDGLSSFYPFHDEIISLLIHFFRGKQYYSSPQYDFLLTVFLSMMHMKYLRFEV